MHKGTPDRLELKQPYSAPQWMEFGVVMKALCTDVLRWMFHPFTRQAVCPNRTAPAMVCGFLLSTAVPDSIDLMHRIIAAAVEYGRCGLRFHTEDSGKMVTATESAQTTTCPTQAGKSCWRTLFFN
jgi:hypothetical protein